MDITNSIYKLTTDEVGKIQSIIKIISNVEDVIGNMASDVESISASIEQETAGMRWRVNHN